jgi:DNA invertase Pin-like site-specific DNA recombinase
MNNYVTYHRVSTAEQGRSGLGLEAQKRDIGLYLENYSGVPYEIAGEFTDVLSGSDNDRPELKKAIELARRTSATLLVAKLDRLSRKVSFIANLMEDTKLEIRIAQMPYADKFQLHIYAALAEQEREFISKRTKAALAEAKAKGKKLGGLRDATMKRNEVLKQKAEARAQKVAGLLLPMKEAGKTLREMASELNTAGVPTARGGQWQSSQVMRVLKRLEASRL